MIFVTGPLFSGKKEYIKNNYHLSEEQFERLVIDNVQDMVTGATSENLDTLADKLSQYDYVIATEIGGGVVPVDRDERLKREALITPFLSSTLVSLPTIRLTACLASLILPVVTAVYTPLLSLIISLIAIA